MSLIGICSIYGESHNYTLSSPNYKIENINGTNLIIINGFYNGGSPGNPKLPYKSYNILLPSNCNLSTINLKIIKIDYEYINKTLNIPPAPPIVSDGLNGTIIVDYGLGKKIVNGYNINVYNNNSFYPEKPVVIANKGQLREAKLVSVLFTPIQYNPVQKKAVYIKKITFKISYNLNNEGYLTSSPTNGNLEEYSISPYTLNLLKNYKPINYDIVNINNKAPNELNNNPIYDYVIITTNSIKSNCNELTNFTNWLKIRGFNPLVITENDYGNATGQQRAINIRNWLKNHYKTYGIKYVLLIGNPDPDDPLNDSDSYRNIPMMMCYPRYYDYSDRESPTDYFYADLTGNWDSNGNGIYGDPNDDVDFYPEVFVGRIPFYGDYSQLDYILEKIIEYENTSGDWRKRVLLPMAILNYENEDNSYWPRTDGRDFQNI